MICLRNVSSFSKNTGCHKKGETWDLIFRKQKYLQCSELHFLCGLALSINKWCNAPFQALSICCDILPWYSWYNALFQDIDLCLTIRGDVTCSTENKLISGNRNSWPPGWRYRLMTTLVQNLSMMKQNFYLTGFIIHRYEY